MCSSDLPDASGDSASNADAKKAPATHMQERVAVGLKKRDTGMQETERNPDARRSQLSARWQTDGQPSCCGVAGQGSDFSCCRPHLGLLGADPGCTVLVAATALALARCANVTVTRLADVGADD